MFHRQFIKKKGTIKGGKGSVIVALTCYVFKGQLKVAKKINLSHAALHGFCSVNGLERKCYTDRA